MALPSILAQVHVEGEGEVEDYFLMEVGEDGS